MLSDSLLSIGTFCLTIGIIFVIYGEAIEPVGLIISGTALFIVSFIFRAIEKRRAR